MSGGQPPPYELYSSYPGPQQPYTAARTHHSYSGPQPPYNTANQSSSRPTPAPRSSLPSLPPALRGLRISGSNSQRSPAAIQRVLSQSGNLIEKLPVTIAPKYSQQSQNEWNLPVGFVQAKLPDDEQFEYDFSLEERTIASFQRS